MTFYDRLEQLCIENGTTPQNKELRDIFGVSSGTITNWKKTGANPEKISTYINIATHFGVTIDYLSGMTECRTLSYEISSDESAVLEKFRKLDIDGKAEVIHVANEQLRRMEKNEGSTQFRQTSTTAPTGTDC